MLGRGAPHVRPRPGGTRASAQWIRRALPFTVSEQGVIADSSLPAVFVGVSGERGPGSSEAVGGIRRFACSPQPYDLRLTCRVAVNEVNPTAYASSAFTRLT